jgi:hypothetical protein
MSDIESGNNPEPTAPPTPAPVPSSAAATAPEPQAPPPAPASKPEPVVGFTREQQAQIDHLTGQARKEAREAAMRALLAEFGVERPDDVKAAMTELKTRRQAEMSETERLKAEAEEARLEREAIAEQMDAMHEQMELVLVTAEVRTAATRLEIDGKTYRFRNPEDALHFLDLEDFEVDMDAQKVGGVEKALRRLAQERMYLVEEVGGFTAPTPAPVTPDPAPAHAATPAPARPPVSTPTPRPTNGAAVTEAEKVAAEANMSEQVSNWF